MQTNPFAQVYKNYTNEKLAAIIANAEDYEPTAVEAAVAELNRRNISADEVNELNLKNLPKENKNNRFENFFRYVKGRLLNFPGENPGLTYLMNGLTLLLIIEYILINKDIVLYTYHYIKYGITSDFKYVSYLLFVFTRLVFIWLFWRRNIVGWVWIVAWAIYCLLNTLISFYYAYVEPTDTEKIRILYPENTGENYLFWTVFCGGILYILYLNPVTRLYKVSNGLAILTGILAVLYVFQQLYI